MVPGYGRDDSNDGGGINLVPGVWKPPERVTNEEAAAARLWLRAYEAETATVSAKDLEKWIATLVGNLRLASASGEDDIGLRIKMLSIAVDDRPAKHFTKDSLKLAWKTFGDFIPTGHQLMAFFDDLDSRERTEAQRLMAVLDAAAKPAKPRTEAVDIDLSMRLNREAADRERAELIKAAGIVIPPCPPRAPGESDRAYGIRLAEEAKRQCDIGGKAMKRAMRERAAPTPTTMKAAYAATGIKPQCFDPPESTVSEQTDPDAERLGGMTADYTSGDDP